jgi:hypothetical protein
MAVSGNHPSRWWFCNQVRWRWLDSLRRRSQNARPSWAGFIRLVDRFSPLKVLHPCPVAASTPETDAGARCVSSAQRDLARGEEKFSYLPGLFALYCGNGNKISKMAPCGLAEVADRRPP